MSHVSSYLLLFCCFALSVASSIEAYPARIKLKLFPRYVQGFLSEFVRVDLDRCYDLANLQCGSRAGPHERCETRSNTKKGKREARTKGVETIEEITSPSGSS